MHAVDAIEAAKVPAGQIKQAEEDRAPSSALNRPVLQLVQSSADAAPSKLLYFPFTQEVQRAAPTPEYVPAPQDKHWLAKEWAAADTAASAKYVPLGHATQSDSSLVLYFPAAQTTQV